jgi:hypothetical protein
MLATWKHSKDLVFPCPSTLVAVQPSKVKPAPGTQLQNSISFLRHNVYLLERHCRVEIWNGDVALLCRCYCGWNSGIPWYLGPMYGLQVMTCCLLLECILLFLRAASSPAIETSFPSITEMFHRMIKMSDLHLKPESLIAHIPLGVTSAWLISLLNIRSVTTRS